MSELFERLSKLSPKRLALLALELQEKLDAAERSRAEPIAIVGMACRLPGAESPEAYWRLLRDGVDAVTRDPQPAVGTSTTTTTPTPKLPARSPPAGAASSTASTASIPSSSASRHARRRPWIRSSGCCSRWPGRRWSTPGIAADSLSGSSTGVYVGMCNGDYGQMLLDGDGQDFDMYLSTGNAGSVASGRVSYVLGLQGPALTVDTACSSSLVAVHLAVQGLRDRRRAGWRSPAASTSSCRRRRR